jgi:UDP-N-acetylglucosamine 1-carboxyvinyltransferase
MIMAAATRGKVKIKNVPISYLDLVLEKFQEFKIPFKINSRDSIQIEPWQELKIEKIQCLPYPGIPTDLQSAFGVLATQSPGSTLIHDPLYEGRLKYLEELNKMGAEIIICDPHRAIINGPTKLYGAELGTIDLRGGASLVIAGLLAQGKTIIKNIGQIDRGYERIEEKLRKLGADIRRVNR